MFESAKNLPPNEDSNTQFDIVCTVHHTAMGIEADQLDAQILIMRLYLSLSALHVSDSLVHH